MKKQSVGDFTKIRKDIKKRFREISSFLINVGNFRLEEYEILEIPENLSPGELLSEFQSLEIQMIFYGSKCADACAALDFGDMIEKSGHIILESEACVFQTLRKKNCALLGSEMSDVDFFRSAKFSAAPRSAPLNLKMAADYVSNFDGESAFVEIGNLIVNSNR